MKSEEGALFFPLVILFVICIALGGFGKVLGGAGLFLLIYVQFIPVKKGEIRDGLE